MRTRGVDPIGTTRNLRRFPQGPSPVTAHYVDEIASSAPNQPITLSGDATGTGTSTIPVTLKTVNANVGTFQGITVNGKGLVTAAANQSYLTGNQTITLSGDLTGSGSTSINAQIAANAVGTAEIANANVTYAKVQNVTAARLLGNPTGSAVAPSEISLGTGLSFAGTVLNATTGGAGTVTSVAAGTGLTASPSPIVGTGTMSLTVPVSVANGGTGVTTAATAPWVQKAGDTMAGTLTGPGFSISAAAGTNRQLFGYTGGALRWSVVVGSSVAESGSNVGSDFSIGRFSDAGGFIDNPVVIQRSNGAVTFGTAVAMSGTLTINNTMAANGYQTRSGLFGTNTGHNFNIDWTGSAQLWMDGTNLGTIAFTSDYRLKDNVADLPSTWEQVKALRPISYTHKDAFDGLIEADATERWGFIAHELQEVLTEGAASGHKDAENLIQSPSPMVVIAALTRALQEAMQRIETLEQRDA